MSYNDEYGSRDNDYRRNQESSYRDGSERRGYEPNEYDSERRGYNEDQGIRTEAGRNAQGHFNSAAENVGQAAAAFEQGGGREAFESVGNPMSGRNENEGEHVNPFLRPAQELAAATQEGLKGLPGAIFEFATEQYEAHKTRAGGHRTEQNQEQERRNEY